MEKYILHPATFKLDGGAMFGIIPKPLWEKNIPSDELNRIQMSLRVMYLETKNKKILIDTAIGDYHSDKFNNQFAIKSEKSPLALILKEQLNINANDITDIIITHLHFDHVGGLGSGKGSAQLVFPNAKIHLHKKHYEYAQHPTIRDSGSFQSHFFQPLLDKYLAKKQVNFLDDAEGIILQDGNDKVEFKISFGHTPYMVHPIFENFIYMADLVPMSHHVKIPWVMGYDIEPGVTTEYKEIFYKYIIEHDLTMIFEHDIETYGAKIEKNERSQFVIKSKLTSDSKQVIKL